MCTTFLNPARNSSVHRILFLLFASTCAATIGCHVPPPSGSVIQPQTLGTVVDEIMLRQEENAEYGKLIIYNHEFEINLQDELDVIADGKKQLSTFEYKPNKRIRGYRLNPAGEAHVRQIAQFLLNQPRESIPYVVVEKSDTSKRWETQHQYPVHFNDELDLIRRQVVVNVLTALGVSFADEIVVVAPAFPTGLNADEASAAYRNAIQNSGPTSNNFFGR